ncbi:MAG: helix-turn-helix domain-containing protein [Chloroflexota bacterium]|nr:helix-turn-helix domain-containing protein [Chloroflexota bacterium]
MLGHLPWGEGSAKRVRSGPPSLSYYHNFDRNQYRITGICDAMCYTLASISQGEPAFMPKLAALRRRKLLTQRELAERAGVALSTLYAIETGRHQPQMRIIRKIAEALDVDPLEVDEFRRTVAPDESGQRQAAA